MKQIIRMYLVCNCPPLHLNAPFLSVMRHRMIVAHSAEQFQVVISCDQFRALQRKDSKVRNH